MVGKCLDVGSAVGVHERGIDRHGERHEFKVAGRERREGEAQTLSFDSHCAALDLGAAGHIGQAVREAVGHRDGGQRLIPAVTQHQGVGQGIARCHRAVRFGVLRPGNDFLDIEDVVLSRSVADLNVRGLIAVAVVAVGIGRLGDGLVGIDQTLVADHSSDRDVAVDHDAEADRGRCAGFTGSG